MASDSTSRNYLKVKSLYFRLKSLAIFGISNKVFFKIPKISLYYKVSLLKQGREVYKKTENNEITGRNSVEEQNITSLKDFHLSHIDNWGVNWNQYSILTLQRQSLSRILYYNNLYKMILGVPGSILEFGSLWGATLSQLISLRGMYEPYNYSRHIYGFDTFEGFVNTSKDKDGSHLSDGDYSVYEGYENQLEEILILHEANCPLPHIKKFSLIKGDASLTSKKWLKDNPHAIIAMAIFDMDIYQPTKDALEAIIPRLTKGSILVFDELNCAPFPGETQALDEVLAINKLKLQHDPHQPNCAWTVWGD